MVFRLVSATAMLLWLAAVLSGCGGRVEGRSLEERNPYFQVGKDRLAGRDYRGAMEAFEKVVEMVPNSPLAHFELGVLYEQHSDQKQHDYVIAMYHYLQVLRLRPKEYPADNAEQRIRACRQELVKVETLTPVARDLVRENDKLKEENKRNRQQIDLLKAQLAARETPPSLVGQTAVIVATGGRALAPTNPPSRLTSPQGTRNRPGPLPATSTGRVHTVKSGDTLASIARRYGVKLTSLMAANPGLDPKRLKAGDPVSLPSL